MRLLISQLSLNNNHRSSSPRIKFFCSINSRIDPRSGIITTKTSLDREKTEVYTVIIQASDLANPPANRRTASATLVVRVLDDNDNYPQFSERTYIVSVPEDLDYTINPAIVEIRATDADTGSNAAIRYAIIGGNTQNTFQIDSQSGDVILVKPLDYESVKNYKIIVRAQDGGLPAKSNTTQLLVRVKDVNDNAPRYEIERLRERIVALFFCTIHSRLHFSVVA